VENEGRMGDGKGGRWSGTRWGPSTPPPDCTPIRMQDFKPLKWRASRACDTAYAPARRRCCTPIRIAGFKQLSGRESLASNAAPPPWSSIRVEADTASKAARARPTRKPTPSPHLRPANPYAQHDSTPSTPSIRSRAPVAPPPVRASHVTVSPSYPRRPGQTAPLRARSGPRGQCGPIPTSGPGGQCGPIPGTFPPGPNPHVRRTQRRHGNAGPPGRSPRLGQGHGREGRGRCRRTCPARDSDGATRRLRQAEPWFSGSSTRHEPAGRPGPLRPRP
jgi:hypothetical protein